MTRDGKDVRVVGAGPAGLMAAEVLAQGGARVTIIDHHQSPARKFLLAGRGGLNLTHAEPLEVLLNRYGTAREHLEPAIRDFPPAAVRDWCAGLGIETFVGSSGRVFPKGLKASPLLRALLRRLGGLGVTLQSRTAWEGFENVPTILAMGGASWPELGSDATWVPVFKKADIAVTPLVASNGRQRVAWSEHFTDRFSGQPIKNVALTCNGKTIRGEVMIARDGIEGGAIYALSSAVRKGGQRVNIDLKPDNTEYDVAKRLARPRGKDSRSTFLRKVFNLPPVAIALMREASADNPKHVSLTLQGAADIRRAISTAGGVAFSEVDENMRLRKQHDTWVAGEMLDWDAPTGGYLLQACFATARWAAKDCLRRL